MALSQAVERRPLARNSRAGRRAALRRVAGRKRVFLLQGMVFLAATGLLALLYGPGFRSAPSSATFAGRALLEESGGSSEFPSTFGDDANKNGAVVVHFVVAFYMFIGLAVVCDDFFVPSLELISERLNLSDDVAGATFMAAGGSAPELFTSVMGVFVAKSDVGFGTIVGSAVFNVLFVISACAVFAREVLELTWWPLLRDSVCYSISLLTLVLFIGDQEVTWYEAFMLFLMYCGYVTVMAYNETLNGLAVRAIARVKTRLGIPTEKPPGVGDDLEAGGGAEMATIPKSGSQSFKVQPPPPPAGGEAAGDEQAANFNRLSISYLRSRSTLKLQLRHMLEQQAPKAAAVAAAGAEKERLAALEDTPEEEVAADAQPIPGVAEEGEQPHGLRMPQVGQALVFTIRSMRIKERTAARRAERLARLEAAPADEPAAALQPTPPLQERAAGAAASPRATRLPPLSKRPELTDAAETPPPATTVGSPRSTGSDGSGRELLRHASGGSTKSAWAEDGDKAASSSGTAAVASRKGAADGQSDKADEEKGKEKEREEEEEEEEEEDDEDDDDLLAWPADGSLLEKAFFVFTLPLVGLLVLTVPDSRKAAWKKFYVVSFCMSLVWIAAYAYMMVWMAQEIGDTLDIPPTVMGLTLLAAGTSVPDAISSVIVARQGLGDMAVSSSIGSNIFDVLVGLPVPWLIKTVMVSPGERVPIYSSTLEVQVITLFLMLISVIATIIARGWRLDKKMGLIFGVLYVIFVTQALLLEYDQI